MRIPQGVHEDSQGAHKGLEGALEEFLIGCNELLREYIEFLLKN